MHRAGEKLFIDFTGQTLPITDPETGVVSPAELFVAVLGASNYTFADVLPSQELPHWIGANVAAFEFFGGVPEILVPDNLKPAVTRPHRYEPELNTTYQEMAAHYGCAVIPARSGKPRDNTGAGKTYLACAIAQAAVRAGHPALYLRAPRLLDDLALAHGDGRWARLLTAWARVDVLLVDDLVLRPLSTAQAADFLEVIEDRSQRRSTIVTSQVPVAHWHDALGDPTLADAILDRLTNNAHRIELSGDSLRRRSAEKPPDEAEPPSRRSRAPKRDAESASEAR